MTDTVVTRELVPEDRRSATVAALCGDHFPFQIEPAIYFMADRLSADYRGGFWDFYTLTNGGFLMAPDKDAGYDVVSPNGYVGHLSADAFGIVVCLFVYSQLSFSDRPQLASMCTSHYYWLREYAMEHDAVEAILRAID